MHIAPHKSHFITKVLSITNNKSDPKGIYGESKVWASPTRYRSQEILAQVSKIESSRRNITSNRGKHGAAHSSEMDSPKNPGSEINVNNVNNKRKEISPINATLAQVKKIPRRNLRGLNNKAFHLINDIYNSNKAKTTTNGNILTEIEAKLALAAKLQADSHSINTQNKESPLLQFPPPLAIVEKKAREISQEIAELKESTYHQSGSEADAIVTMNASQKESTYLLGGEIAGGGFDMNSTPKGPPRQQADDGAAKAGGIDNDDRSSTSSRHERAPLTGNNKLPPIVVENFKATEVIDVLSKCEECKGFNVKNVNTGKCNVLTDSLEKYNRVKETLRTAGIPFFSFTPKTQKVKSMILKGLSNENTIEEVKEELYKHNSDTLIFSNVKLCTTKNIKSKLFLIQVSADSQISELIKVKSLLHQAIKWEPLKKQKATQCRKCQRFGHVASNCNMTYRCVKCKESHVPGQCNIREIGDKEAIYCVNCKEHGHPASFRGCIVYQNFLAKQNLVREKKSN